MSCTRQLRTSGSEASRGESNYSLASAIVKTPTDVFYFWGLVKLTIYLTDNNRVVRHETLILLLKSCVYTYRVNLYWSTGYYIIRVQTPTRIRDILTLYWSFCKAVRTAGLVTEFQCVYSSSTVLKKRYLSCSVDYKVIEISGRGVNRWKVS